MNIRAYIEKFLRDYQTSLDHPECYLGKESNTYHRDWDSAKYRILIACLWRYEDVRGNQTIPLLYQMINEWRDDIICERAFFPNTEKDYTLFRKKGIPIFGVESKHCMGEYDLILTSLSYLPPWINFPLMLDLSGIPPFWKDRLRGYPIIMVGGSAMYGNFSPVYPVADMIYLGDAEEGLFPVLDDLMHKDSLVEIQLKRDYIFVPSLYVPEYGAHKFVRWNADPAILGVDLKTTKVSNLDNVPALTKPFASYTDASLGLGEVELSRGCRGACVFCGLSWKYRPYRERSREKFVELMKANKKNSGTYKGLCPIAAEFAFYKEKRALFNALHDLSETVDPLSMRVDAFAQDEQFALCLSQTGMNNLAIGVEGISQRIRNWMMKGVSEEDIFKACQIAIEGNVFKKIKFFLISNVGETDEDWDEFFGMLKKIVDYIHHNDSKMIIKVSWTPLFVEPCTPLQWMRPTIDQRQPWKKVSARIDELNPTDALGNITKRIVTYPRGGGGKTQDDFLWMMQGLHLGDTRFAEAVVYGTLELKMPLFIAFSKDKNSMKAAVERYFERTGYSWDYLMRERTAVETFPWDIVDRGVTKKSLRSIYEKIKSGEQEKKYKAFKIITDDVPLSLHCGLEEKYVGKLKGCQWLVRYRVDADCDVVPNTHWNAQIHRAAYLEGLPISVASTRFFGDRACRNWYSGDDYFYVGFYKPVSDLFILNKHLSGMQITGAVVWDGKISYNKFYGLYEVSTDLSRLQLESFYLDFEKEKKVEIVALVSRYFSGFRKRDVNVRAQGVYYDLEIVSEDIINLIKVKLCTSVGIRYFLKGLLPKISQQRVFKFPIWKKKLYKLESTNLLSEVEFGC